MRTRYPFSRPIQSPNQRDADAGVARRRFHNDGIGTQSSVPLGSFDHCQRYTVFDATAGVEELGLCIDALPFQVDQWCIADEV
jgi:hypothetical protein